MAFLRICTGFGLLLAVLAADVTPIEKVTNLLTDLKADVEAKGKEEATTYGKFACFCKDTTKTKSTAIEESQDKIDQCTADIEEKTATRKEKIEKKKEEQQKIEETEIELQKATEVYEAEKVEYEASIADLTKAINSAKRAHKVLSDSKPSFIDLGATKSDVRSCLDLADALNLVKPVNKAAMASFLQVDPSDPAYKFHSEKILTIIKDLQTDFETEKTDVQDKWKITDEAYKEEKTTLEGKITTAKEEVETLTGAISELKSKIAGLNVDLDAANESLKDDSAYLHDLTSRCEEKAHVWDQRTKTRSEEVDALTKAMEILAEKAADADTVNKRALLVVKAPVVVPAATAAVVKPVPAAAVAVKAAKPATDAKPTAKKSPSFLQVSRTQKIQDEVVSILRKEGTRLNSAMLSSVASQIAADPFVKVKKLIQGLIERLLAESKAEATKKGFCDTELGKSYEDRKNRYAEINSLDADLEDLKATEAKLTLEISELTEDLIKLRADLKKADEDRVEEKADNEALIKSAGEGSVAVQEALVILQDFYKSAAKNSALLQVGASPVDEDSPGSGLDGAYKGDQDSSRSILGLLEVIKSDYDRTERKTTDEEADAHAKWILFERTSKSDISAKDEKKALDEADLDSTTSAITQGLKDLQTATDLLDGALKNVEDLKPTCIDTGMSYAERVEKREEEIAALKKACTALMPDGKPSDCE